MITPPYTPESVATAIVRGLKDSTLSVDVPQPPVAAREWPRVPAAAASGALAALGLAALSWVVAADSASVFLPAKYLSVAASFLAALAGFVGGLTLGRVSPAAGTGEQSTPPAENASQDKEALADDNSPKDEPRRKEVEEG